MNSHRSDTHTQYRDQVAQGRRDRTRPLRRVGLGIASIALLLGTFAWMMVASAATAAFREGVGGYTGAQDTFLDEAAKDTEHGSDVRVGVESSDDEQGLLRFDGIFGTNPGQIPPGATITSASLEVYVTNTGGGDVRFHRMLEGWNDSDTWNSVAGGIQTDGVQAVAVPDLAFSGTGVGGDVTISGLEASLQAWSDGAPNQGWVLLTDSTDGWDIGTSESSEANRPRLVVEFDAPVGGLFVVNSTDDDSDDDLADGVCDTGQTNAEGNTECTLRAAIEQANNAADADTVEFDIPTGDGGYSATPLAWTLHPGSQYDYIVNPVTIDATTQPGFSDAPVIQLDGGGATGTSGGLVLRTDDSTITGFIVHSFDDEGLEIDGSTGFGDGNTLSGNWVGIDASQTLQGNADNGILVTDGAQNNVVDGNVVGGSSNAGIQIRRVGTDGNEVTSNYVGIAPDGVTGIPNAGHGIAVTEQASGNRIGLAGSGNVIGSNGRDTTNQSDGIYLGDPGTTGNSIVGNFIGVSAAGTGRLGNNDDGIAVMNGADGNTIGGTGPSDGNVIGDAGGAGGAGTGSNHDGIYLENVSGTVIVGNTIGTDLGGTIDLGNEDSGLRAWDGVTSTLIGGAAGANIITNNPQAGVLIHGTATGVAVVGNSISGNGALGIDLDAIGVDANDPLDLDAGANDVLNYPDITSVVQVGPSVQVNIDLDLASGFYRIDLYESATADPSGFGEGETPVAAPVIDHPGGGSMGFALTYPGTVGPLVTATTTHCTDGTIACATLGSTSEFSLARAPTNVPPAFQEGVNGYTGTEDTHLWQHEAATIHDAEFVTIDLSENGSSSESQGLIQFGGIVGPGAGQIPSGSTINSASLQLHVFEASSGTITVHPMMVAWDEAATWNSFGNGIQRDGFETTGVAEVTYVASGTTGQMSIGGFENSLQAWVDGTWGNNGWAIFNDTSEGWDFRSSEYSVPAQRPRLVVDFTPNAGPAFDQDLGDRSDPEGTAISLSSVATDPEGHGISYSAIGLPPGLSIHPTTGLISGTITLSAEAGSPFSVQITATDDYSVGSVDTFTWTVTNTNQAPTVTNPGDRSNNESASPTFGIVGTDPDGDGLSWSATGLPDGLSIDSGTGIIAGTLSYVSAGIHPVTVRATDPGLLFDEVAFTWTVLNVNRGPSVDHPGQQTVAEGGVVSLAMTATDPDGEPFTWSATNLPPGLSIDPTSGEIAGTVTFGAADTSPYASSVSASDNGVPSASGAALIIWTVTDTNRTPVVTGPGNQVSDEDDFITMAMSATDPDGDGITWSTSGLPVGLSIDPGTGTISGVIDFTAAAGSPYAVVVTATDDGVPAMAGQVSFTWTVDDINRVPSVSDPGDQGDAEGDAVALPASGSDPDGDTLTWSAVGLPPGLSIDPATGEVSGTLTFSSAGIYPVTLRATDDGAGFLFDQVAFTWDVAETNRPPVVANPGDQVSQEGAPVSLTIVASDPELDGFVWSATGLPPGLTIDPGTGEISGDLQYNAAGASPYIVDVTATDDGVPSEAGSTAFSWGVTDVNLAPTITDPGAQTSRTGEIVALPLTATDPEGDGFTWSATGLPDGLSIDPVSGEISGVMAAPVTSVFTVTVRAMDTGAPSAVGEVQFKWVVADDLAITKVSDAGGAAAMGQAILYTITIDNPGPAPHTGVTVTDALPAGTGWISSTVTYPVDGPAGIASDGWDALHYLGSTGSIPWAGPWFETGDDGDPLKGSVKIHFHNGRHVMEIEKGAVSLTRAVDLSSYGSATVAYEFRRLGLKDAGDVILVEVSSDGSVWSEIARHVGPGDDEWQVKAPIDISEHLSSTTMIRFRGLASHDDGELRIDWVEISAEGRTLVTAPGGTPPNLVSGITLLPGETMTVEMVAGVDDPLDRSVISIDNTAEVASDQQVVAGQDSATDAVNHGPLFDQDRGNQTDAENTVISLSNPATDPNGDTLTWSASGLPSGLSIASSTGVISGTVDFDAAADSPYAVTLRVEDPDGTFHLDSFTWTIGNTNRTPLLDHPGDQSDAEADTVALAVTGSDPDGDGLTWSAAGLPPGLSIDPSTGLISGTITYWAAPGSPYAVTVRLTDGGAPNLFGEVGFSWAVTNTNRAPLLVDPGAQSAAEGDATSLLIAGSDPDLDGLTWSATGLPAGLAMNPATGEIFGTITYDASASSPHVVTIRATDDGSPSLFDEAVFLWTVTDTNRPPVLVAPAAQSDAEGEVVSVPVAASDPDIDTLTWTASGLPPGLLMDSATGIISGTLTYESSSIYTVTVRVTDDRIPFLFDEVSFIWDVADVNRNPMPVNPGDQSDAEGDSISLLVIGSDPDLDTITWTATGLPGGLTIDPSTGVISGTISYDASPSSPFPVAVVATDDGTPSLATSVAFSWTVADTNRAPVLVTPGDRANGETDVIALPIPASDPDLDTLTWTAVGLPPGLSIDAGTGEVTGTVSFDAAAGSPFTVTVTVEDDRAPTLTDEITFSWLVANTNRAPIVVAAIDQASDEGAAVALPMTGFDPDGDGLTWSATGLPDGLTISSMTGTILGEIDYSASDDSPHVVMVTATDDGNPSLWTTTVFTWMVADVNRPPTLIDPGPLDSAEGDEIVLLVGATDPDDDVLTWAAVDLPDGLTIDAETGVITGPIGFEAAGVFEATVSVTDDRLPTLSDEITLEWTVANTNRAPVLTDPGDRIGGEGDFDSVAILGSDPDGNDLSWTASGLPGGVSINPSSGVVTGTLSNSGVFSVTVTATDDGVPALAASVGFTWIVTAIEPIAPIIELLEDRSDHVGDEVTVNPKALSPDGESISWSAVGLPDGVDIDVEDGVISGTLVKAGVFEVEVIVTDPRDLTATAGFVWTVGEGLPVDEPPRAEDDVFDIVETALEDGRILLAVLDNDNDPEGTGLRITWLGDPDVGEASIVAGAAVSFRPPEDWLGSTRFSYVVADAVGNTDTASVVVTIQPDLDERAAGTTLQWTPPEESRPTSVVGTIATPETTLVVGSIVQSLHVLRMPLTLLGGAVVWSLLLGGAFNLTLLLRGGVPFISRKARLHLAVVLAGHGQKVPVHIEPGEGEVIHRFGSTAKGVGGTGRVVSVDGVDWAQVETPEGRGWVEAMHLTEHIDAETFMKDPAPQAVLGEFVEHLRDMRGVSSLVSRHGLWVSHHDDPVHYTSAETRELTTATDARVWRGRNPAFPDITGTFQEIVAAGVIKVWDRPERLLEVDKPSVPSTIVPVEYTNFHAISIGAKVTGRERLDQVAWMAHFAYEDGTPYLIALTKEG